MVNPAGTQTLLQQMKIVAQQFLGLIPTGSYYDFNGTLYTVGGIDPTTGKIILTPVSGGGTTLLDPIAALYPNAVPAPIPTVPITPASSGGIGLQSLLGLGGTGAQIWQTSKLGKQANAAANAPKSSSMYLPDGSFNPNYNGGFSIVSPSAAQTNLTAAQNALTAATNAQKQITLLAPTEFAKVPFEAASYVNNQIELIKASLTNTQNQINALTDFVGPLTPEQYQNLNQLIDLRDKTQNLYDSLVQSAPQDIQAKTSQLNNQIQKAIDDASNGVAQANSNLQQAQFQSTISTNFQSINDHQAALSSSAFDHLTDPQKESLFFDAQNQLKAAGNKAPSFDDIQSLAEKNFATNMQLTPQDLSALRDIARQNAIDNNPGMDTSSPAFDKAVQKEMTDLMDPANLNSPDARDLKNFLADKQKTLLNADQNKYNSALRSEEIQAGIEFAAAAGAGYAEEKAIASMFENGFSFKNLLTAAGSAAGMYLALHLIHNMLTMDVSPLLHQIDSLKLFGMNFGQHLGSFLKFLTGGWGFLAIQGLIILLGWLLGKKPPPEQVAAETLNQEVNPMVWNPNGQVIFLTAGLTMATLGLNLSPSAPMMQTMTLSQASATEALVAAGASSVPSDSTRYADVFVEQGGVGQPTRVVYLTPTGTDSKGRVIETMTVQTLKPGMQFAASQPTGFIPFFIPGPNGKPIANPQVVQSLSNQGHLLLCANGTWVSDATKCAEAAGASSHVSNSGGH